MGFRGFPFNTWGMVIMRKASERGKPIRIEESHPPTPFPGGGHEQPTGQRGRRGGRPAAGRGVGGGCVWWGGGGGAAWGGGPPVGSKAPPGGGAGG